MNPQIIDVSKFAAGALIVVGFSASETKTQSGSTKKDNKPYTISRTQAVINGRFAEMVEYSNVQGAKHQHFVPGPFAVLARNIGADPKNPSVMKISLSSVDDSAA